MEKEIENPKTIIKKEIDYPFTIFLAALMLLIIFVSVHDRLIRENDAYNCTSINITAPNPLNQNLTLGKSNLRTIHLIAIECPSVQLIAGLASNYVKEHPEVLAELNRVNKTK